MTPTERITRNSAFSDDPFSLENRVMVPIPVNGRVSVDVNPGQYTLTDQSLGYNRGQVYVDRNTMYPGLATVWRASGIILGTIATDNGRGALMRSGTNTPLILTAFHELSPDEVEDQDKYEGRLAAALNIDRIGRIHNFQSTSMSHRLGCDPYDKAKEEYKAKRTQWNGSAWVQTGRDGIAEKNKIVDLPVTAFRVLDAHGLRDDFYTNHLAYCATTHTLAVAIGNVVYKWSEPGQVMPLHGMPRKDDVHITGLSFSSESGKRAILAIGRSDNSVALISMFFPEVPRHRIILENSTSVAAVAFKPVPTMRPTTNPMRKALPWINPVVQNEDLLVATSTGEIRYYVLEWPHPYEVQDTRWLGKVTCIAIIPAHSQTIPGLVWSPDGKWFASGGNDNTCVLFNAERAARLIQTIKRKAFRCSSGSEQSDESDPFTEPHTRATLAMTGPVRIDAREAISHKWKHDAAIKAIAFCPWADYVVASGGGSNDKCIQFHHTRSGALIATIGVSAQVTGLFWSTTRREIAATFGYPQPDHPFRIIVYSYPECQVAAAIPWGGDHRALCAVPYPIAKDIQPSTDLEPEMERTQLEGCLVVASSNGQIKFHEVWADRAKTVQVGGFGNLGGSFILEETEGVDHHDDMIR